MAQENTADITQKPEFRQVMQAMMLNYFQQQKKSTLKRYEMLNRQAKKGQILFAGSSLMEFFPISEMQSTLAIDSIIYNRGIGATTTDDLIESMDTCIFDLEPTKLFMNIGSNDIGSPGYTKEKLVANYDKILRQIKERLPACAVYVMAYYPVNAKADFGLDPMMKNAMFATRSNESISAANEAIEQLAQKYDFSFINVNEGLADEEGNLKAELSVEGLHLWPNAYEIILENMKSYL